MKKNIIIAILSLIILILIYKLLNPSVITQRKQPQISTQISESTQDYSQRQNSNNKNNSEISKSPLNPEFRLSDENSQSYDNRNNEITYGTNINRNNNDKIPIVLPKENRYKFNYTTPNDSYHEEEEISPPAHINEPHPRPIQYNHPITMCKPYKETLTTEYMGMDMTYTIDILGWVNNKCILNFEANINGTCSSFYDEYGIKPDTAQIFGFAPKVRCEFTKQQLLYVGDNILQESNRDKKMLKNPEQIEFPNFNKMTFSDLKLLQIILNDKACKVINSDEFTQIFEGLFQF